MPTCLHARRSVDKTVGVGAEVHDGFERGYHLHRGSLGTNGVLEVGKHEEVFPGGSWWWGVQRNDETNVNVDMLTQQF